MILEILFFLVVVLTLRFIPGAGEWYATSIYPTLSAFLSRISSFVPFSLDEVVCLIGLGLLLYVIIQAFRGKWNWKKGLLKGAELLLTFYLWFLLGWGGNYYRADFFERMQVSRVQADKDEFMDFACAYRDSLNAAWTCQQSDLSAYNDQEPIIQEIKALYEHLPVSSGLCQPRSYHRPKVMLLNRLYSAAGVMGFMGPWMGENLLNGDLLPVQFPSVYAHELSHLLGVTSEAEANYWAYYVCTRSSSPAIRYSGYLGLLPNVLINARALLSDEEYRAFYESVRPEAMQERRAISDHWLSLHNEVIDECQNFLLNLQLKGHGIPSGTANYNEVVQMIMAVRNHAEK